MQNEYEEARITLVAELTTERSAIETEIAAKKREVLRLNQERVKLAQTMRIKEAGDVSSEINGLQSEIKEAEERLKGLDVELENARQWKHPKLSAARLRMEAATTAKQGQEAQAHHDRLRKLIGEDHRQAARGLIGVAGAERTRTLILGLYEL